MDPTQQASLRAIWAAARDYKEAAVHAVGVGTDLPKALVLTAGRQMIGSFPIPDDPTEAFATVLANVALSDCDLACMVAEMWVSLDEDSDGLAGRFADGDPAVQEALMCVGYSVDGEWRRKISAYRYDGRTVRWARPEPSPVPPPDYFMRAAAQGFRERETRQGPALVRPGASLQHLGSEQIGENIMVTFAYHAACPCGSGRPIKHCCAIRN